MIATGPGSDSTATLASAKVVLRELIERCAGIPARTIHDHTRLSADLAMDSMSLLSLQTAIEQTFGVVCDSEELFAVDRFGALAAFVVERAREATGRSRAARRRGSRSVGMGDHRARW